MTSSQGLCPAKLLRVASLVRSSPLIRPSARPERFEGNHRRNRYERITLFVETFIASDQIEEAKLSHARAQSLGVLNLICAAVGSANFSRCPCSTFERLLSLKRHDTMLEVDHRTANYAS